jgi:hypothetical protein
MSAETIVPRPGNWCRQNEEILAIWAEHGIPFDRSTLEQACSMLFSLHAEYETMLADLGLEDDEPSIADDEVHVANQALGRTHSAGNRAV